MVVANIDKDEKDDILVAMQNTLIALKVLPTRVESKNEPQDTGYEMLQNYPNPFNSSTLIPFTMAKPGHVTLKIYGILGRQQETLVDSDYPAGYYTNNWAAQNAVSGVYFVFLQTGRFTGIRKMIMIR